MSLSHILGPTADEPPAALPPPPPPPSSAPRATAPLDSTLTHMPPPPSSGPEAAGTPKGEGPPAPEQTSPNDAMYTSTTTSTRRNASGSVSSVYSGNKMRHLKKEDGIPLWRKDIQFDFLRLVFSDNTPCFTKYSDGTKGHTFAEIYIDAMAKSSKCSKILKEKLLQDTEGAVCMAMVCLLVNVGRMNTTLNFFPEMRAQLRTYHSIPALQARQDPNAYKQLQDAPRLKSILKGATEDEPQPTTIDDIKAARIPRTNPVNLIFVLSQFAPKISEVHFPAPRDFFDLVMRPTLTSASRARAFLWLLWWYLESDFSREDSERNPFGRGVYAEGDRESGALPLKVPTLESLNEEQAAAENVDTDEEILYGEIKRKERIAILASEPSPAMTALKRARKEKGLITGGGHGLHSEDEHSEAGMSRYHHTSVGRSGFRHENASDYTRSPSPVGSRGFNSVNSKGVGDMRINNLLNDDVMSEASPPRSDPLRKGRGRGNWRRDKQDPNAGPSGQERSQHVKLLPNNGPLSFVNENPMQANAPGYHSIAPNSGMSSYRDHVPTPSYQATKRNRGVTQHQSAVITHRRQQIEYTLDRRIRKVHVRARDQRELEGPVVRAWKRIRTLPLDYDSEEEQIKIRKALEKADKDDESRTAKGRENVEVAAEDLENWRRPRVHLAGLVHVPQVDETDDIGEEARSLARAFRRVSRRLERWQESVAPGDAMIRRRQKGLGAPGKRRAALHQDRSAGEDKMQYAQNGQNGGSAKGGQRNHSGKAHDGSSGGRVELQPDDEDGGDELDDEEREMLAEVDVDESEDEDVDMEDD